MVVQPDGSIGVYGSSDFIGIDGVLGSFPDTIDAVVGVLPGAGRSFPSFVVPYRGGVVGENLRQALDFLPLGRKLVTVACDFVSCLVRFTQIG